MRGGVPAGADRGRELERTATARGEPLDVTPGSERHAEPSPGEPGRWYDHAPIGPRIADEVTGFMGSWRFLILQTGSCGVAHRQRLPAPPAFDPYPFILLNLAFSTQAAYAAPLILLAGNRSAQRDRLTLEHAATRPTSAERAERPAPPGNHEILEHVWRSRSGSSSSSSASSPR